jgi:hypothetical protein
VIARQNYNGQRIKRTTELGTEKLCPGCQEWWPHTAEFFSYITTRGYYHNQCLACRAQAQVVRRQTRKTSMDYQDFVASKLAAKIPTGLDGPFDLPESLFPMQVDLVTWALKRGRAAIFADTGLGKSRMQVAWAAKVHEMTGLDVMILAPLAVAQQTIAEGAQIDVHITRCKEASDVRPGINITNYDRVHKFDCSLFGAVVLDESSCIKHHTAKTLQILIESFGHCQYKLCATATPAPNDWTELGTHAEFLGICSRSEMLAEYFVHDGGETQTWRLKGHARHIFWRWVASWGAMIRKPSDLGYDDAMYALPPLNVLDHLVDTDEEKIADNGMLFALEASTLTERREAKKASLENRVGMLASMVNGSAETWVIWCELNAEADALRAAIPDAVEIRGPDDADLKERRLTEFAAGEIRVLITKPSITGWGLNWQHCCNTAFVGVSDSFEAQYQAIRRFWRFGQKREVNVHRFASQLERAVLVNLDRKQADSIAMGEALAAETRAAVTAQIKGAARSSNEYNAIHKLKTPSWLVSETAQ